MKSDAASYPPGSANDPSAPYNQEDQVTHLVCKECGDEDIFTDRKDLKWHRLQVEFIGDRLISKRFLNRAGTYEDSRTVSIGPLGRSILIDSSPNRPYDEKTGKWQCLDCGSFDTEVKN